MTEMYIGDWVDGGPEGLWFDGLAWAAQRTAERDGHSYKLSRLEAAPGTGARDGATLITAVIVPGEPQVSAADLRTAYAAMTA